MPVYNTPSKSNNTFWISAFVSFWGKIFSPIMIYYSNVFFDFWNSLF
ncbi:hypothetical protein LEP1GSC201_0249 [Leptospira interrogans serovar Pomona str. Fox 32256]|nr:hypothetical protein LEP1GSC201_0249 [Leptospira interrogans serovar Pomona str. Fox 32256]